MTTYRKKWPCCGSATETKAWIPKRCPFCELDETPSMAGVTPLQAALAVDLGRAVLATAAAQRRLGALGGDRTSLAWQSTFDTWRDAFRAETNARAALAATVAQEVSDG